jgi:hypothetical protein
MPLGHYTRHFFVAGVKPATINKEAPSSRWGSINVNMSFDFNRALKAILPLDFNDNKSREEFFSRIISYMYFSDMDIMEQSTILADTEYRNIIGVKGNLENAGGLILLTHLSPVIKPLIKTNESPLQITFKPFSMIRRLDILAKIFSSSLFSRKDLKKPVIVSMIIGDFVHQEILESLLSFRGIKADACVIYAPTGNGILNFSRGFVSVRIIVRAGKKLAHIRIKEPVYVETPASPRIEELLIFEKILSKGNIFELNAAENLYDGVQGMSFYTDLPSAKALKTMGFHGLFIKDMDIKGMNKLSRSGDYLIPLLNLLCGIKEIIRTGKRGSPRFHIQQISTADQGLVLQGGLFYPSGYDIEEFISRLYLFAGGQEKLSPDFRIDIERGKNFLPFQAQTDHSFYRLFKKTLLAAKGCCNREKMDFPVDASLCDTYKVLPLYFGSGGLNDGCQFPESEIISEEQIKNLISVYEGVIKKFCGV